MAAHTHRDADQRLEDILAAITRIKNAELQFSLAETADDEIMATVAQDAVLYNLVVIGEAVNALPLSLTEKEEDVPWRNIVDMRNYLSHEYFRIRLDIMRRTID